MTFNARPDSIDPGLAAQYLAWAEERGGPDVLERTALRTRSRQARDLFAYAATAGRYTADGLVSLIRSRGRGAHLPALDRAWTIALARVIGKQNLDESDLTDAVLLLEEVHRQHGRSAFRGTDHRAIVDRLWQAGATDQLKAWSSELRRLKPSARRFLRADLVNPFGAGAAPGTGDRQRWQALVDEMFTEYGLESLSVAADAPTPFDGLTCDVDDPVLDGPMVTVIISVFKPGPGLLTSVRSICQQTWRNIEILLMDDASPDEYSEVIETCAALDPRIRHYRMERNGGTYLARNAALDLAKGEFVTCQDADDWSHPRRIELQARALITDPDIPATRSYCLRVQEDLHFQRPGYETSQENAVSLMFRREQALRSIGYFDRARKGADTEYRKRLERATGRVTLDLEAPLSMYRMGSGSLSRADFTPGWHHASRVIYRNAYERWHKMASKTGEFYLDRFREDRPFAIPQRFQLDQSAFTESPLRYDVVFLSDWRYLDADQAALLEQVELLVTAGYRVGVAHRESYVNMTQRRMPLRPEVLDLVNAGGVDYVALDQVSSVSLLLVRSPDVLQFASADPGALEVSDVIIVASEAPCDTRGGRIRYSPATCDANARAMFSVDPTWVAQNAAVRSLLSTDLPEDRLAAQSLPEVLRPDGVPLDMLPRTGAPTVGWQVDDSVRSDARAATVRAVLTDESVDVRILGDVTTTLEDLGRADLPFGWTCYEHRGSATAAFLDGLDYYLHFEGAQSDEMVDLGVARAISRGCVAILPPTLRAAFGAGALYAEPQDVPRVVQAIHADPAAHRAQVERGRAFVRSVLGGDAYVEAIAECVGPPRSRPDQRRVEVPRGVITEASNSTISAPRACKVDPLDQVEVVVAVSRHIAHRLSDTLQRIWDEDQLVGALLSVVYAPTALPYIAEATIQHPNVTFVPAAGESREDLAAAACSLALQSRSTFVSVANLPRSQKVRTWARSLRREVVRIRTVALEAPVPVLVWTSLCSQQTAAGYLAAVLARDASLEGAFNDYLGRLALLAASARVEAIDSHRGIVQAYVWFAARFSPEMSRPRWKFRIGLVDNRGVRICSAPGMLTERVDRNGRSVWENLEGALDLRNVRKGNYHFTIELDSDVEALKTTRSLRPTKGVLLDARTVEMCTGAGRDHTIRYLVHTVGAGSVAFLTVQSGQGTLARLRWAATLVRKDLASVFRGRVSRRIIVLRLVRLLTRPYFAGRRVWLIGERTDTAQDNGMHLFRYLRRHMSSRDVYYVIEASSAQRARLAELGNVISHSSWKHQLLMLHAEVLANAYSIRYLTPASWGYENYVRHLAWRIGALRIYLKHGVHLNPSPFKRGLTGYDMVLTAIDRESEALRAVSGYDHQIHEIGMPRYDGLTPAPASRTVLFMPTWRQYLVPRLNGKPNPGQIPFEGSTYEQFIVGFLRSPRLHELLEKHDYQLTFLPHYNIAPHFDNTVAGADRISLADTNVTSFQDLLRTCDAFITDYSSVHFDVAYLGTPVIYARFDEADYEAGHASRSWFDYERDGYGPVVRTVTETLDALEEVLERGCTVQDVYAARVAEAFTYRDRENSARVVAAIDDLANRRRRAIEQG